MNLSRIRTGFSFRAASGSLDDVMSIILDHQTGNSELFAPISDRASTFGWVKWAKLAAKKGAKPVFGVELAVTDSIHAKKPSFDHWTFFARDDIGDVNRLVELATTQFRYQPLLTYEQALAFPGAKIIGHRSSLEALTAALDHNQPGAVIEEEEWRKIERTYKTLFFALGPSTVKGYARGLQKLGIPPIAASDNKYPRVGDRGLWEVICGRGADTQSYAQHIMSPEDWWADLMAKGYSEELIEEAEANAFAVMKGSTAGLKKAKLLVPEKPKTLRQMCIEGAERLGCDLTDSVYRARMDRELLLIEQKNFEDYFFIVADICTFARANMLVGPARGSSCGSLVCYLLGITTVDPILYNLSFERFLSPDRSDEPDIDIDFAETRRHLVFEYLNQKYGNDHVARLGTVAMYKGRSALQEAGGALKVPRWKCEQVGDVLTERQAGDERALKTLEDAFADTDAGRKFITTHPEMAIAAKMEGHPRHGGQHAAGVIICDQPVRTYVAIDHRTGATMCDKKDAEELALLKIDALGLTQLSVFEDALEMAGLPRDHLQSISLDDQTVFDVLSDGKFTGIFQFAGDTLQRMTKQTKVADFNDLVSLTALARPGPLQSGQAEGWLARKNGRSAVKYWHEMFEPHLRDTLGIIVFQEQVMSIAREIGGLPWEDVTGLRKAMAKTLGKEAFDKFGTKWKTGAIEKGLTPEEAENIWNDLCSYGKYGFNKCLDGKTRVHVAQCSTRAHVDSTIEELYKEWVLNPSEWMVKKGKMPVLWSMNDEGKMVKQMAKNIVKNGAKEIWKYTFDDGSFVECTKNHKFIINGNWKEAEEALIGDEFTSFDKDKTNSIINGRGNDHAKGKSWKLNGGNARCGENNVGWTNGVSKYFKEFKAEWRGKPCTKCGQTEGRMEAHHNDFAHGAVRPKDLTWLCVVCHKKTHYDNGRVKKDEKPWIKDNKKLTSIEFVGIRETYDIEMPKFHNFKLFNGILTHNSHSVAYSIITYQCCWLKAYHPFEFAAATLTHEKDPDKQIKLLKEMAIEGYDYIPIDAKLSTDRWTTGYKDGKRVLVGPLQNVKGIGPKMVASIVSARARDEPLSDRALKLLDHPTTPLDSLFPIRDAFARIMPDPTERQIYTPPTEINKIVSTSVEQTIMVFCTLIRITLKNENEPDVVAKRGFAFKGDQLTALNLILKDDTDEIFAKVDRYKFASIGREIMGKSKAGKSLWAIKGTVRPNSNFRMLNVTAARHIGELE